MKFTLLTLALAAGFSSTATAYDNNCDGSSYDPPMGDCRAALANIRVDETYIDGDEFSHKHCMVQYRTFGHGRQPIKGQILQDHAWKILEQCHHPHGSMGTGNCRDCHITVNYRADDGKFDARGFTRHGIFHSYLANAHPSSYYPETLASGLDMWNRHTATEAVTKSA